MELALLLNNIVLLCYFEMIHIKNGFKKNTPHITITGETLHFPMTEFTDFYRKSDII